MKCKLLHCDQITNHLHEVDAFWLIGRMQIFCYSHAHWRENSMGEFAMRRFHSRAWIRKNWQNTKWNLLKMRKRGKSLQICSKKYCMCKNILLKNFILYSMIAKTNFRWRRNSIEFLFVAFYFQFLCCSQINAAIFFAKCCS